jgi:hypothetical protein
LEDSSLARQAFVRQDIQRRWYDGAKFVNEERVIRRTAGQ